MVNDEPRDPFLEKFFSRIHPSVAQSFTPAQIAAIKLAFGARTWGAHSIDIRLSLPLFWRRFYLVLLAGREQRRPERAREGGRHPFATLANAAITVIFCLVVGIPILLSLYMLQLALSMGGGGGGSFLAQLMEQLNQLFK